MADNEQVREILNKLDEGVKSLFESDKYVEYLKTMSRFHNYSTRNTFLIHMQKPSARRVAGYQSWKNNFKRQVKKGEHGIKIYAPMPFAESKEFEKIDPVTKQPVLDENGLPVMETLTRIVGARFKIVSVFDISQTEGEPLPELVETLTGDVARYELFVDALRKVSPLPIGFEELPPDTDGFCSFGDRIAVRDGMSQTQTICAIIHEITHAKLHDSALALPDRQIADRRTEEVTAESVSFVVNNHFGIETGANSFGYIAEWSKTQELKELNASIDVIRKTASELIDSIEEQYLALAKERGIDLTVMPEEEENGVDLSVASAEHERETASALSVSASDAGDEVTSASQTPAVDVSSAPQTPAAAVYISSVPPTTAPVDNAQTLPSAPAVETNASPVSPVSPVSAEQSVPASADNIPTEPPPISDERIAEILAPYINDEKARSPQRVGVGAMAMPVFIDGNYNRSDKRIHVTVEEPIGKYRIFSSGNDDDKTLYFLTASGRIAELFHFFKREWSNELHKNVDVRPTESEFDEVIIRAAQEFKRSLSDPAKWAHYPYAAVVNQLGNCDVHNIPVRKSREEEDNRRHEEAERVRKEEAKQKSDKYNGRIDEIADAVKTGKAISVGYKEYEFDGKNPVLDLFRLYGIELPLRTQGWVNTGLAELSGDSYRYYKSKHKRDSTAFYGYLKKLKEAIDKTPIEEKRAEKNQNGVNQNNKNEKGDKDTQNPELQQKGGEDMQYSDLQKKGMEIARGYMSLPLQDRLNIIAEAFNRKTASVSTKLCTGKYRGLSDIILTLDNGASMPIGLHKTNEAKNKSVIDLYVNNTLAQYNPQIVAETKQLATAALKAREAEDNQIAEQKGLKPYKFLNVELCDGSNANDGALLGLYYASLAVDGKIFGIAESNLGSDISRGVVTESVSRPDYFVAGGLKDADADFVFNNVGFSSFLNHYKITMSGEAIKRAEAALAGITADKQPQKTGEQSKKPVETLENRLYNHFSFMFPKIVNKEFDYMKLESEGFEPLSIEYIDDNQISVMHTYKMNGDLMYDPMIVFEIDKQAGTLTAVEFEQSMPPLYQRVTEDNGDGQSIDGNGNERAIKNLQGQINGFAGKWFNNIEAQQFLPVIARLAGRDENARVDFDKNGVQIIPKTETPKTQSQETQSPKTQQTETQSSETQHETQSSEKPPNTPSDLTKTAGSVYAKYCNIVAEQAKAYAVSSGTLLYNYEAVARCSCDQIVNRVVNDLFLKAAEHYPLYSQYTDNPDFKARLEDYAYIKAYLEPKKAERNAQMWNYDARNCNITPETGALLKETREYGYANENIFPLKKQAALEMFDANQTVYLLYNDNTEDIAFDREEIERFDGLFGMEKADWEKVSAKKERESEKNLEAYFFGNENNPEPKRVLANTMPPITTHTNMFAVYQVRDDIENVRDLRFASYSDIQARGMEINREDYKLVYAAPLTERIEFISEKQRVLNNLFEQFNTNRPADYTGRSMSVSDVVVLRLYSDIHVHFVDTAGIREIDRIVFYSEKTENSLTRTQEAERGETDKNKETAENKQTSAESKEKTTEQKPENANQTFYQVEKRSDDTPTVAQLEADVKAGKSISLTDLAKAIQAEPNNPPKPKGKPDFLAKIESNKQRVARENQPPQAQQQQKNTEREERK